MLHANGMQSHLVSCFNQPVVTYYASALIEYKGTPRAQQVSDMGLGGVNFGS